MTKIRPLYFWFFVIAAAITIFLLALNIFLGWTIGGDSEWYITAAEGNFHELIEPYSGRFLHPFIVGLLGQAFSVGVEDVFFAVAIASLFLFFVVNTQILKDTIRSPFLLIPLFLLPYFFNTIREVFQPDPLYILLTALFFLLLFYKKEMYALLVLFLLFLSRESTVILGLLFAIVSFLRSKKLLAAIIFVVMVVSFYTTSVIKNIGQPNPHDLSGPVYLVSKLSYNFMTNVVGLRPWVNTRDICEPVFRINVPSFKSLGDVREVGFCGFDFSIPLKTVITLLTIFGIAPLVLAYILFKRKDAWKKLPFWALVALIYGVAHYFVGVVAGTGVQRIVGYGWPAFLLVAPFLIGISFEIRKEFIVKLSLIHLFVAWLPLVVYRINGDMVSSTIFLILVVAAAYWYALRALKKQKINYAGAVGVL